MNLKTKSFLYSLSFLPLALAGQYVGDKLSVYSCNLLAIPGVIYIAGFLSGIVGGAFAGFIINNVKVFDKKIVKVIPILFLSATVIYFYFQAYQSGVLELVEIVQNYITVRIFLIMLGEGVIVQS